MGPNGNPPHSRHLHSQQHQHQPYSSVQQWYAREFIGTTRGNPSARARKARVTETTHHIRAYVAAASNEPTASPTDGGNCQLISEIFRFRAQRQTILPQSPERQLPRRAAGAPTNARSKQATEHNATATTGPLRECAHTSARDSTRTQVKCLRLGLEPHKRHWRWLRHRLSRTKRSLSSARQQSAPCKPGLRSNVQHPSARCLWNWALLHQPFTAETVEGKIQAVVTQALKSFQPSNRPVRQFLHVAAALDEHARIKNTRVLFTRALEEDFPNTPRKRRLAGHRQALGRATTRTPLHPARPATRVTALSYTGAPNSGQGRWLRGVHYGTDIFNDKSPSPDDDPLDSSAAQLSEGAQHGKADTAPTPSM